MTFSDAASLQPIADRYLRFARNEAAGRSPLYEALALHVAGDVAALRFLQHLPKPRQQPNLLFAALRLAAGTPASCAEFDAKVRDNSEAIAQTMLTRTTQTNEPGRCATLLPALPKDKPIALIEVGASAGLCLWPDRYGYDWGHGQLAPPAKWADAPVFPCTASANTPLPDRHPRIVWRAGLDLNPMDLSKPDDTAWLEMLVWPEHHARLQRLRAAITMVQHEPPVVRAGNLLTDLPALIAEAPKGATVVVFHSAVLSYVPDRSDRDRFASDMARAGVVWISNEGAGVLPQFSTGVLPNRSDMFVMTVNARTVARTGPHGERVDWL